MGAYYKDTDGNYYYDLGDGYVTQVQSVKKDGLIPCGKPNLNSIKYNVSLISKDSFNINEVLTHDWKIKESLFVPVGGVGYNYSASATSGVVPSFSLNLKN